MFLSRQGLWLPQRVAISRVCSSNRVGLDQSADNKFQGQWSPAPECGLVICQHLQDNHALGQEGVIGEAQMATTLHDMIADMSMPNSLIL